MILSGRRNNGLNTLALMIMSGDMKNFPVLGFPSSCGDVQPQRTSLVIRTEHNFLNKNKSVEQWRGNRTVDMCLCFCFLFVFCCKNRVSHDAAYK